MRGFIKTIWAKTALTIKSLTVLSGITTSEGLTVGEALKVTGEIVSGVTTLITDGSDDILLATGETVPTDAATGYAKGCLFIDTNVATGTSGLYVNVGINTACVFKLITNAA